MSRVEVEPRLIQWAMERSALTPNQLAHRFPKVREWATGDALPTLPQLEEFARATTTPIGYLFLAEPPEERLPVADFRTMASAPARRPSPNLLETVYLMQRRQDFMRELLVAEGHDPLPFVGAARSAAAPEHVAGEIRRALGLPVEWARDISTWKDAFAYFRDASEAAGVLVVVNGIVGNNTHRKLDPDDFRGFALVDGYAPLVFVNGADAKSAQIFTLAHELAHVITGESGVSGLPELGPTGHRVEQRCNAVAGELLVPAEALRAVWPSVAGGAEPFQALARRFKVSALVAARRALDLGFASRQDYRSVFQDTMARERARGGGGGDFWANQTGRIGRRFGRAVVVAAREGRIMYRSAYELSGLSGTTFDHYSELVAPRASR